MFCWAWTLSLRGTGCLACFLEFAMSRYRQVARGNRQWARGMTRHALFAFLTVLHASHRAVICETLPRHPEVLVVASTLAILCWRWGGRLWVGIFTWWCGTWPARWWFQAGEWFSTVTCDVLQQPLAYYCTPVRTINMRKLCRSSPHT